ncbi:hypothetical protein ABPG72_005408 [Tetrahymena utriculariae]
MPNNYAFDEAEEEEEKKEVQKENKKGEEVELEKETKNEIFDKYPLTLENKLLCKVCFQQDNNQQIYSLSCCYHQFHYTCLQECFTAQKNNNIQPIKCPNFECLQEVQENELKIIYEQNSQIEQSIHNEGSNEVNLILILQIFLNFLKNLDSSLIMVSKLNELSQDVLEQSYILKKQDQKQDCEICMIEMDENFIQTICCGHKFHQKCLEQYIIYEIKQTNFPIKCPQQQCLLEMQQQNVKEILNEQDFEQFENFQLYNYINLNQSEMKWCPTPDCQYAFIQEQGFIEFSCPVCNKEYCLACQCEQHYNQTCEQYQITQQESQDKQFEDFAEERNFKKCPSCKFYIEKSEGCDHITCRCGYEFCYLCGGTYNQCYCNSQQIQQNQEFDTTFQNVEQSFIQDLPVQQQEQIFSNSFNGIEVNSDNSNNPNNNSNNSNLQSLQNSREISFISTTGNQRDVQSNREQLSQIIINTSFYQHGISRQNSQIQQQQFQPFSYNQSQISQNNISFSQNNDYNKQKSLQLLSNNNSNDLNNQSYIESSQQIQNSTIDMRQEIIQEMHPLEKQISFHSVNCIQDNNNTNLSLFDRLNTNLMVTQEITVNQK